MDELQESYHKLTQHKEKYKNDLEICTNYLLEVEEKCQEAQKTSLELLQQLKEREFQIEKLQEIIVELQKGSLNNVYIYHPVKDDPVDKRLAEYINNAPVQLRNQMQFQREQEGIYKYGKKRVFMKIEGESIIIRVGGGYLTIEEFIEQYSDGEESQKKKLYGLIYGGNCSGSKENFKTFYFTQKSIEERNRNMMEQNKLLSNNNCFDGDTANSDDFDDEDTPSESQNASLQK